MNLLAQLQSAKRHMSELKSAQAALPAPAKTSLPTGPVYVAVSKVLEQASQPLTAMEIAALTHYDAHAVRYILRRLTQAGVVKKEVINHLQYFTLIRKASS